MTDNDQRTGLEIAVIGMAGRFPGARNIAEFWDNIKNGMESVSFLSRAELKEAGVSEQLLQTPGYVKAGGGILEDADCFDASFFGYLPTEAEIMDPQVRLFHECAWAALEDAGYNPDGYDGLIGLYGGAADHFYWEALAALTAGRDLLDPFTALQLRDKDFMTTWVSYRLNLRGPAVSVYTACSTSLVAVDQACRGLLSGLCDMALAGGAAIKAQKPGGYLYRDGTILSKDGHCRAFAEKAAGTVFGSGVGLVVLKRLEEAIAHGDHIYCLVSGFAINNDGIRKAGFSSPSIEGQAEVIRAALQMAEASPESIGYIETHGTGTVLGDSVEIEGLKLAFQTEKRNYCAIGSVKTNTGHLDTAAGITGLIKMALAFTHRLMPPTLHHQRPHPDIDLEESPFFVNTLSREWKRGRYPRRAGVSSFGIGGTNAHVVLEEAPELEPSPASRPWQLLLLSAKTAAALDRVSENTAAFLRANPGINLADAAYTLQRGRKTFAYRKMLVCATAAEAARALAGSDAQKIRTFHGPEQEQYVVFMFPGQGAQYVNMGWQLYRQEPLFREEMDRCFDILRRQPLTGVNLKEILYPGESPDREGKASLSAGSAIHRTEIAQPLLFIFEYALARWLMKLGVRPRAMIGHSIGEYVAAAVSGVFSLEQALELVLFRGGAMQKLPGGSMLSVPLAEDRLIPLLKSNPDLSLAAVNSPSRCVVSGCPGAVERFAGQLSAQGCQGTRVHTSHAFHSPMMQPLLAEFADKVKQLRLNPPALPYLSNVTGTWIKPEEAMNPVYWARHLRETVRFAGGIGELLKKKNPLFIELGPGNALSTLVRSRDSAAGETPPWAINTVKHPREETDDLFYFLEKIGQLWLQGIEIHWDAFYAGERRQRLSLPPYPFEPKRYRLEGDLLEIGAGLISRPPLQKKFARADWFYLPLWEESALPSRPAAAPAHLKWLLFIDTGGWGTRLAGKLAEMGQQVTVVRQGPAFEKLEEEDDRYGYLLDPGQGDSYDTLFRDLRESDRVPDHLVHLWNVERPGGSDDRPVPESLEESQDIGLYSLLNIVQALGRQSVTTRMEITAITTQMQQVTGDEAVRPEKATLLGAVKIIPLEYINIRCRSIDIAIPGPGSLEDKLVSLLLEELFGNSSDKAIAYRGLKRWVPVMKPQHLEAPGETDPRLKKHGVYLISGGFGGMGFTLAGFLASAYQAKLILVGRSPFPQRRQWEEWVDTHGPDDAVSRQIRKIRQWEEQGAEIEPARADISDFQEMSRVIARAKTRFGHIDGLLHTAGVIDWGGVIQKRTRQATEEVMAPKVRGTLVLDALLREEDLDFFVLFSSMGNVFYNIKFGEIGYAAANEFLDAFANSKSLADKTFTLAINWSDWLEVGMSAASARQQQGGKSDPIDYEAYSLDAVTPAEGVQVFRQILAHRYHRVGVATKDLDLLLEYLFRPPARPAPDEEAAPETFAGEDPDLSPRPELSTPCVDPGDNLEQQLAGLFRRYFGIRKIGIYDDFFELGGDSLKALTLSAKIHRLFRVEIPLPVFFRHPTISGLAQYIGKAVKSEVPAIMPTEEKEYYPLSSPQTRFYILQQIEPGSTLYNMPTLLVLETAPDKEKLESTFKALIRRHGSLRTSFTLHRDTPVQRISRNVEFAIQYCDLQAGTQPTHTDLETLVGNFIRPFDLAQPPLLRVRLIRTREDRYWLLLDLHHLVSDFGSQVILREDFQALGQGRELPALRLQYRDYAQWQNHEKTSARIKRQESYWLREFAGELPVLKLPTDFPRPAVQSFQGNTLHFRMDNRETRALKQIADKHKATLFMVFLALETVWLSKICGQEDLIIGVPLVGRSHADLEKLMGVFLNTLAIRSFPRGELTFREFLAEVRDKTLKAFANQDYGFEDLVEALKLKRDTSRNPLFDAAINFYNFQVKSGPANKIASETNGASGTDETNRINGTKATRGNHLEQSEQLDQVVARYGNDIAHNDLMLYMEQDGSGLKLSLEYCTKLFKQETLERWIDYFREVTAQVIEKESVKLTDLTISHELRKPEPGILQEDLEDFDF